MTTAVYASMNTGRYILSQILDLIYWQRLSRLVARYYAESRVRHFGCRQQLICVIFPSVWREGLWDIADCIIPTNLHKHLVHRNT